MHLTSCLLFRGTGGCGHAHTFAGDFELKIPCMHEFYFCQPTCIEDLQGHAVLEFYLSGFQCYIQPPTAIN